MFSQSKLRPAQTEVTTTSCALCGSGCRLKIITASDGSRRVAGDRHDPISGGQLCRKGLHALELMNHPPTVNPTDEASGQAWRGKMENHQLAGGH